MWVVFSVEILATIISLPSIPLRWEQREIVAIGVTLGLVLGSVLGITLAISAQKQMRRADWALLIISGEFSKVVQEYFDTLKLTAAKNEVVWFIVKGMSISEIANLRGLREGTIKVQGTAIYKKAGVTGKSRLVSLLVEDLLM